MHQNSNGNFLWVIILLVICIISLIFLLHIIGIYCDRCVLLLELGKIKSIFIFRKNVFQYLKSFSYVENKSWGASQSWKILEKWAFTINEKLLEVREVLQICSNFFLLHNILPIPSLHTWKKIPVSISHYLWLLK